jgi:hypothetical protein
MTTIAYAGSNPDRQAVGLPGHCDNCARFGHVDAHPRLGCSDVGCTAAHAVPAHVPDCWYCGTVHDYGTACPYVADDCNRLA